MSILLNVVLVELMNFVIFPYVTLYPFSPIIPRPLQEQKYWG